MGWTCSTDSPSARLRSTVWSMSLVSSAASRPSRFLSYTVCSHTPIRHDQASAPVGRIEPVD
uniref:Uncharacterized protein n=1 Tax=Streptomyces auratus AGR0001 TaxID=1160718 RepID=J1RIF2_9ACTN